MASRAGAAVSLALLLGCGGSATRPSDAGLPSDSGGDTLTLCHDLPVAGFAAATYEMVLDRSAGMAVTLPGSDRTVWERVRDVLLPFAAQAGPAGLTLFPDDGDCARGPVAVPASTRKTALADAMAAALGSAAPAGARPAAAAVALAIADGNAVAAAFGRPTVVLFTNGAPDAPAGCGQSGDGLAELRQQFQSAYDAGIYTCIAALPGTGAAAGGLREVALAGAGGDPSRVCYFDYDSADGPERLAGDLCASGCGPRPRSCLFRAPLDETHVDGARLLVTLDGAPAVSIARTPGCAETSGWDVGPDGASIQLCDALCDQVAGAWSGSLTLSTLCYVP